MEDRKERTKKIQNEQLSMIIASIGPDVAIDESSNWNWFAWRMSDPIDKLLELAKELHFSNTATHPATSEPRTRNIGFELQRIASDLIRVAPELAVQLQLSQKKLR